MIIIIIIQTSPIDCNHQHVDYGDHPTIRFYKVEELNIYNTLVDCVSNWREKFAKCNLEITALGMCKKNLFIFSSQIHHFFLFVFFLIEKSKRTIYSP